MAIKLRRPDPTEERLSWMKNVAVEICVDEGRIKGKLDFQFLIMPPSELDAELSEADQQKTYDFVTKILRSVRGMKDEDGEDWERDRPTGFRAACSGADNGRVPILFRPYDLGRLPKKRLSDLACALFKKQLPDMSTEEEQQLRQVGATDEFIEQKREAGRRHAAEIADETPDPIFTIWPDMEDAIRIFQFAQWDLVAGMAGAIWTGVRATEIEALASMLDIETDDQLLADLQAMQNAASKVLNAKK